MSGFPIPFPSHNAPGLQWGLLQNKAKQKILYALHMFISHHIMIVGESHLNIKHPLYGPNSMEIPY